MTERRLGNDREQPGQERPLSTADMVAAAERQSATPDSTLREIEEDSLPVEPAASTTADRAMVERERAETIAAPAATTQAAAPAPNRAPASAAPSAGTPQLLSSDQSEGFRSRWDSVQTSFVDEPRQAVEKADALVAEVMKHLAQVFADERAKLEGQWSRGDDVSTEDLRVALQRYRSFFDRLLSV